MQSPGMANEALNQNQISKKNLSIKNNHQEPWHEVTSLPTSILATYYTDIKPLKEKVYVKDQDL